MNGDPRPARDTLKMVAVLALAAVVPVAAAGELIAGEIQYRNVPTLRDWRAAAAVASAARAQGSGAIVVTPRWAGPLGRMVLGTSADPKIAARSDLATYPRVITLGPAGHRERAYDPLFPPGAAHETARHRVGPLVVRTYEQPGAAHLVRDLVSAFDENATVVRQREGGAAESCRYEPNGWMRIPNLFAGPATPKARFLCPPYDPAWTFVAPTVVTDLNYVPRRCLFMQPTGGSRLRVTLPPGPVGRRVVGYVGLEVFNERELSGPRVFARVSIGDQEVAVTSHADGEGWKRFEGNTEAFAGKTETATLETWIEGFIDGSRPTCVYAELRD